MLEKGFFSNLLGATYISSRPRKRGVQGGGAPLAGVWGCPPDTISTPSWRGRGREMLEKGFFSNLLGATYISSRPWKRGVQRGGAPLAGVWGCPPDTISTPSWRGRGREMLEKGLF